MSVDDTTEGDWDHDGGANHLYYAGQRAKLNYENALETLESLPEKKYPNIHSLINHIKKVDGLNNLKERESLTRSLADMIDVFDKKYKKQEIKNAFKSINYYLRDECFK